MLETSFLGGQLYVRTFYLLFTRILPSLTLYGVRCLFLTFGSGGKSNQMDIGVTSMLLIKFAVH